MTQEWTWASIWKRKRSTRSINWIESIIALTMMTILPSSKHNYSKTTKAGRNLLRKSRMVSRVKEPGRCSMWAMRAIRVTISRMLEWAMSMPSCSRVLRKTPRKRSRLWRTRSIIKSTNRKISDRSGGEETASCAVFQDSVSRQFSREAKQNYCHRKVN